MEKLHERIALTTAILAASVLSTSARSAPREPFRLPDDAGIRDRLRAYVDDAKAAPGVVVGVLEDGRRRFVAYGRSGIPGHPELDRATYFEIGSITKVFTGQLLADAVERGEVRIDDPIGGLFPPEIRLAVDRAAITLEDLATHHSGLPRIALDLGPLLRGVMSRDPYAGSTADELFRSVAKVPGRFLGVRGRFSYSNLGMAVLGQLLARRAGRSFEGLLRERVLRPMELDDIVVGQADPRSHAVARGHLENLRPAAAWHLDAYAPAGALSATAEQMLAFSARALAGDPPALREAERSRRPAGDSAGSSIGLGWLHRSVKDRDVIWHNGGTGGFRTFLAIVPEERCGLVVLTNGMGDADSLALALLDPALPSPRSRRPRWGAVALTLSAMAMPSLVLAGFIRRRRRPRGPVPPLDRLGLAATLATSAIVLLAAARWGAWADLPFALGWASVAVGSVIGIAACWEARHLAWCEPAAKPRLRWRVLGLALRAGALLFLAT
ncbi:MAG: beta-lactamase family protein [Acidobacteriia bacterium]|nr:beta-lactamase family protein [Terriglobia bacterium]